MSATDEQPDEGQVETVTVIEKVEVLLVLDDEGDQSMVVNNSSVNIITALGMVEFAKTFLIDRLTASQQTEE